MSTITVVGSAHAAVTPDRAVVRLAVTHLAPSAAMAMAEVADRGAALVELLDRLGIAPSDWATSGVQIGEETEWRNDRTVVIGQRATTTASVTVRDVGRDAAVVGRLLRDAVDGVGARVEGISWLVDEDNPARLELLAEAARDARLRADAYASALGLQIAGVEEVSEIPIEPPTPHPGEPRAMMMKAVADAEPMPVSAGEVAISARVHVRFTTVP